MEGYEIYSSIGGFTFEVYSSREEAEEQRVKIINELNDFEDYCDPRTVKIRKVEL